MPDQEYPNQGNLFSNGGYPQYPGQYPGQPYPGYEERPPADDEIDLHALFLTLLRRKWEVLSLTVLGVLIAGSVVYFMQPVYQSEGTILISETQQTRPGGGSDLENLLSTSYGVGMGSTISNELQVLASRQLSEAIADRLMAEDVMEDGRRFPLLWEDFPEDSTMASRERVASRIRENMEAVRAERDANVIRISFESYSPYEARWMVNQTIETYMDLSAEQNRMAANSALEFLEEERQQIEQRLAESEERLRDFMNQTGLVQIDSQTGSIIQRISDLESRRQEIRTNLVAINSGIETYEAQLDRIMPGLAERYAENVAPTLERYQFQLAELETERLLFVTRNPRLRENPEQEPQLVAINDQIDVLKEEINRLASKLAGEQGNEFMAFLSDADGNVTSRVSQLRNRLVELRLEQAQALAQQQAIDERLAVENESLDNLPENMTQLARLRRDVQINEQLYETISSQYAETSRWEQTQFGLGRPLDQGFLPGNPIKPRTSMIMAIGLLLGGMLGTGLALGRERLNNQIDGAEKLKKMGYPLLSVIPEMAPFIKKQFGGVGQVRKNGTTVSTHWISVLDVNSPVAEAYRRLQNNIIYSSPDSEFKTIVVTSTGKGEGKTTTAVNLAAILAETGKKVLLIDSDLRMPFTHKLTGLKRSPGIMEMLFEDIPLGKAIQPTLAPNVDILTAGYSPNNPTSIIHSKTLLESITSLKERYDHIVLDTAPYGVVTDAAPMMQMADGVVVVVRFGKTRFNELKQTLENLERIRANVLGTLITRYKFEESADYYTAGYNQYYYSYRAYEDYQSEASAGSGTEDEVIVERNTPSKGEGL